MKSIEIMIKNLKGFIRDRKALLILIMIPVIFYVMIGLIFGNSGSGDINLSRFTIGFINQDLDSPIAPINEYQSIEMITTTVQNINRSEQEMFHLTNYTQTTEDGLNYELSYVLAQDALEREEINAILVFEEGFQADLNEATITRIGFLNNDTSEYTGTFPYLYTVDALYGLLQNMPYEVVNLSKNEFNTEIASFENNTYDYFLVVEDGYENQVDTGNGQLSFYHGANLTEMTLYSELGQLNGTISQFLLSGNSSAGVLINTIELSTVEKFQQPKYHLYFLQSSSDILKTILEQTVQGIVGGIINFDSSDVIFDLEIYTTGGQVPNDLTYSTPGYLMYGILNTLSFTTIIITTEIKEGLLKRLRSSRMRDIDLFLGNIFSSLIIIFTQLLIGILILGILGFDPIMYSWGALIIGIIINTLVTGLFINTFGLTLTSIFKTPESAGGGVWIFLIPLMMFSGVFFPIELMSEQIANIFVFLPTRMAVLAFQAIMVDGYALTHPKFWGNILGQLGYILVFSILGVSLFRNLTKANGKKMKNKKHNTFEQ